MPTYLTPIGGDGAECPDCGETMTYAKGFGWVCQACLQARL